MIKIISLISKQKEILNKLANKIVNPDDLIYRYSGFSADEKFNEFGNAFSL